MKILYILTSTLLLCLASCISLSSFQWETNLTLGNSAMECETHTLSNGYTHIFCLDHFNITYRTLSPQGVLSQAKYLARTFYMAFANRVIAVRISDDGRHMLLAYRAYNNGAFVYFMESINGGENWSIPIKIGPNARTCFVDELVISMLFEKDTGRVCIAYSCREITTITFREPGQKTFESSIHRLGIKKIEHLYLDYTIDKTMSKKYYHMFSTAHTSPKVLYYSSSDNGGRTWTSDTVVIRGFKTYLPTAIAINTQIVEGGIYFQYTQRRDVRILWSKNHGNKWEAPFISGNNIEAYNILAICGTKEKGIMISGSMKYKRGLGYIKYTQIGKQHFTNLPYPFDTIENKRPPYRPMVSCASIGDGLYSIVFTSINKNFSSTRLVRGIIKDTTILQ